MRSCNCQEEMFRRNVVILKFRSFVKGFFEHIIERSSQMLLRESLNFRQAADLAVQILCEQLRTDTKASQQRGHHTIRLLHERGKQVQRFHRLVFMARGGFLRFLNRLLRLHGHLVKTQHFPLLARLHNGKGASTLASPLCYRTARRAARMIDYLPAAAATAGVATLTLICLVLASSRFGMVSVSTPSLYSALIASEFTVLASEKLRLNEP